MWIYEQPVEIQFGTGILNHLKEILEKKNLDEGILICQDVFVESGLVERLLRLSGGRIKTVFSQVDNNPTVVNVDSCAKMIRDVGAKFVVALGGGSVLDCSKASATLATVDESIVSYHDTGKELPKTKLPLIALPTTAGTGSEVTCIAVLSNHDNGKKAPINSRNFYPDLAIIDSELTHSMPSFVTASTGIDVLCHAIEGFWSKGHQPICDALALHAARLVYLYLERAYNNPNDVIAREKMAEASVIAGLAFTLPKTTACHAISFPLTTLYNIPHGEGCAMTLDKLIRINADSENGRLHTFAKNLGFKDAYDMADTTLVLKKAIGLRTDLKAFNLTDEAIEELIIKSEHPNLYNNPVELTQEMLRELFLSLR